jgi:ornithine cyclodeaminase/alanine dehydrogenase-like protein (mu-crystallin family)
MLMIRSAEVAEILADREADLINVVRDAYILHECGQSSVPHSTFLRFPGNQQNRIVGLPAYLGGDDPVCGMPGTFHRDPDRIAVFSPFGLGILDLAVARFVWRAVEQGDRSLEFRDFQPGDSTHPSGGSDDR